MKLHQTLTQKTCVIGVTHSKKFAQENYIRNLHQKIALTRWLTENQIKTNLLKEEG